MADDPNLDSIIGLMNKALTDKSFTQLVFVSFTSVKNEFKPGDSLSCKIFKLVEYVATNRKTFKLLTKLEEINVKVFAEYKKKILQSKQSQIKYQRYKAINQLIQYLEGDLLLEQLQPFYSSCRPDRADRTVTDIKNMVTQLDRKIEKYSPLIPFVVQVKHKYPEINQSLENWLSQYDNLFGYAEFQSTSNSTLNPSSTLIVNSSASSLLIEIKKLKSNHLELQAWFWSSQLTRNIQEKEIVEVISQESELDLRYKKLGEKFTKLIENANILMRQIGSESLRIEIFLPTQLLQENDFYVDWITIQKLGNFVEMCRQYIVIFRLAERLGEQYQDLKENWRDKWRQLTSNNAINSAIINYSHDIESRLNLDSIIGIKLDSVSNYPNFFKLISLKALPIALWSRCDLQTPSCLAEINRILTRASNFQNLLQQIQDERNAAPPARREHIGHHICLLCDDPERVPPDLQKIDNALIPF